MTPDVSVVGAACNALTFMIMTSKSLRIHTTCVYMACIALSDWSSNIINFTSWLYQRLNDKMMRDSTEVYCRMWNFLLFSSVHTSVCLMIAMTSEKFIAVVYPLQARVWCTMKRCYLTITCIVLFTLTLNSHNLYTRELIKKKNSNRTRCLYSIHVGSTMNSSRYFVLYVWPWIDATVYCFIPISVLAILNICIVYTLQKRKSILLESNKPSSKTRSICRQFYGIMKSPFFPKQEAKIISTSSSEDTITENVGIYKITAHSVYNKGNDYQRNKCKECELENDAVTNISNSQVILEVESLRTKKALTRTSIQSTSSTNERQSVRNNIRNMNQRICSYCGKYRSENQRENNRNNTEDQPQPTSEIKTETKTKSVTRKQHINPSSTGQSNTNRQVMLSCLLVTSVFVLLTFPFAIVLIISRGQSLRGNLFISFIVASALTYTNHAVNFFIYLSMTKFRDQLKKKFTLA